MVDRVYHVPWSRHLLSCLHNILDAHLLVGARAVTYNPHFAYFCSPDPVDVVLGADLDWKPCDALLLLDSFAPERRLTTLTQAQQHTAQHGKAVWVLRYDQPSVWSPNDLQALLGIKARLVATLPAKSLILHDVDCWSYAKWDSQPSRYNFQLWLLWPSSLQAKPCPDPLLIQTLLGRWDYRRYDFHHHATPVIHRLIAYRNHQQDALRFSASGSLDYFGGTDGSGHRQSERQGSGLVVTQGDNLTPVLHYFAPVGGPFASLRVEAVALLCLLEKARISLNSLTRLTVFIDSLCLLDILLQWGKTNFWPEPADIIHFDVLLPLLKALRQWSTELVLVKVKGHTGCFHNEMADELADKGCASDEQRIYNGPQKYGTLHLRIQPSLRELVSKESASVGLPSDLVPNKSILKQVVRANLWRSVRLRSTIFARDLVQAEEGKVVARIIAKHKESEIRCWMQAMTGTYPVAAYLQRIGKVSNDDCQYCSSQCRETFTHFMSVCPRFQDARVSAHNQIRASLSSALYKILPKDWILHEETPMSRTNLQLSPVPTEMVKSTGRVVRDADIAAGEMSLGRWQPDFLIVSYARKTIAILDVIRPSDIRRERLCQAHQEKLTTYAPLCRALRINSECNWEIRILPWVVGARGLVRHCALASALDFLDLPKASWMSVINSTVHAAVTALCFMHRIRFSQEGSSPNSDKLEEILSRRGTKRNASNLGRDHTIDMTRWKRMAASTWRR